MSQSEIHNHGLEGNFTLVPNSIINHDSLNIKERFYLIWALSLPPKWQLNTKSIATMLDVSPRTINTYNKSLKEAGYLVIEKLSTGVTVWHFFATTRIRENWEKKQATDTELAPKRNNCVEGSKSLNAKKADQAFLRPINNTDLFNKTLKDISSQMSEQEITTDSDLLFPELKKAWPNNNNMKRAERPFKKLLRGKSSTDAFELVSKLKTDIQARLKANQLGFTNMMLSTYLNGERWQDDVMNHNNESVSEMDDVRKAANLKAKKAMGFIK